MDYEFSRNEQNEAVALFSSGHEAIGHFLEMEVAACENKCQALLKVITDIEANPLMEFEDRGQAHQLCIRQGEVAIRDMLLDTYVDQDLPESTELYDQEHQAECGLYDFKVILEEWLYFIRSK